MKFGIDTKQRPTHEQVLKKSHFHKQVRATRAAEQILENELRRLNRVRV